MSPLESYLKQVHSRLPRKGRDDVMEELRGALLDRLERREAEWGRPLTEDEQRTIIRGFGHPYLVAARYWTGSGLFGGPFTLYYRSALLWGAGVTVLAHVILAVVRATRLPTIHAAIAATIPGMIFALLTMFFAMTIVFMALAAGRSCMSSARQR